MSIFSRAIWGAVLVPLGLGFLAAVAYFWLFTSSPPNLMGGMPLFMVGLGLALLGPLDFLEVLLNAKTRRGICLFCQPVTPRDFFVPNSIKDYVKRKRLAQNS